jgi:hypothetical protein
VKAVLKLPDPSVARVKITKDGIDIVFTGGADEPVSSAEEDWDKALAG